MHRSSTRADEPNAERAGRPLAAVTGEHDAACGHGVVGIRFTNVETAGTNAQQVAPSSINEEMDALAGQADGVQWTGANRTAFDGDLGQFKTVVATGTAQIDTDISSIKAQVDSSFNPVLSACQSVSESSDRAITVPSADTLNRIRGSSTAPGDRRHGPRLALRHR